MCVRLATFITRKTNLENIKCSLVLIGLDAQHPQRMRFRGKMKFELNEKNGKP